MGDFNYDLLEINTNQLCQEYMDSMISNGFVPKITLPTKINRIGKRKRSTMPPNF